MNDQEGDFASLLGSISLIEVADEFIGIVSNLSGATMPKGDSKIAVLRYLAIYVFLTQTPDHPSLGVREYISRKTNLSALTVRDYLAQWYLHLGNLSNRQHMDHTVMVSVVCILFKRDKLSNLRGGILNPEARAQYQKAFETPLGRIVDVFFALKL